MHPPYRGAPIKTHTVLSPRRWRDRAWAAAGVLWVAALIALWSAP